MDILISSNLERFIYEIVGNDAKINADYMSKLKSDGIYNLSEESKAKLKAFESGYATEEMTSSYIKDTYEKYDYIVDPHTAVAGYVCDEYKAKSGDTHKSVVVSTASPYKFTPNVMKAIDSKYEGMDVFELIEELHKISKIEKPNAIKEIEEGEILHNRHCKKEAMLDEVKDILNLI